MRVLAGWRNCECELVGLEEATTLATTAMQRALPLSSALELEIANRAGLARTKIDLAYYAIVIVAVDAFAPYLDQAERVWHREILSR